MAPTIPVDAEPPAPPPNGLPREKCDDYASLAEYRANIEWLELAYENYSVCYTEAYAHDAMMVSHWLVQIENWLFAKYGIDALRQYDWGGSLVPLQLSVVLVPSPDANARNGFTSFLCCYGAGWGDVAFIPYLTPSNYDWLKNSTIGILETPHDHGHLKNLMHEFTHAVQYTAKVRQCEGQSTCEVWDDHWVEEGLAEYEGTFSTTRHNRTVTFKKLIEYVENNDLIQLTTSRDGSQQLEPVDTYFGGNLLLKFLADRFGKDLHYRLMHSVVDAKDDVLSATYDAEGVTAAKLFADLWSWTGEQAKELTP